MRSILSLTSFLILALTVSGCKRGEPEKEPEIVQPGPKNTPPPFTLHVDKNVTLSRGGSAKLKVSVKRNSFDGPIMVEAGKLPPGVTAAKITLADKQNSGEIELSAEASAAVGEKSGVAVTANARDPKHAASAPIKITVREPFVLQTEPADLQIRSGATTRLKVNVTRQGYDGPIVLELRNLPHAVRAGKVTLPRDKQSAELVITADGKAQEKTHPPVRLAGQGGTLEVLSADLPLQVLPAPFTLEVEPARVQVGYGESIPVKVSARRRGYQGPITLDLRKLPASVKVPSGLVLPKNQSSIDVVLTAAAGAASVESKAVQVAGQGEAGQGQALSPPFTVAVIGPPFQLRVLDKLTLAQGAKGKLKIIADRKDGFNGAIKIELTDLPKHLTAPLPATITAGQKETEIEVLAGEEVGLGDHAGIHVLGTTIEITPRKIRSRPFPIHVLGPFSLTVQPEVVSLTEGDKKPVTVKVKAERRAYDGPITLALGKLPAGITAGKAAIIPAGKDEATIELTAPANIAAADKKQVAVLGTSQTKKTVNAQFTVALGERLFDVKMPAGLLKLPVGEKSTIKVVIDRKSYKGPIDLELRSLPATLSAAKATVPEGQSEANIAIDVQGTASGKVEFQVQGTATKAGNQVLLSPTYAITLVPGFFELKTEPVLQMSFGTSVKLKVTAVRKGYKGSIAVEVRGLPKDIVSSKNVIPAGKDQAEIDIKADEKVPEGDRVDVYVRGTAQDKQIYSPNFTLCVGTASALELKVEPAHVKAAHNQPAKVKVTAVRKGYNGPITVDLRNLPEDVETAAATIPEGKDTVELTLIPRTNSPAGTKKDVCVVGVANGRPYASPHLTLTVSKK